MVYSLLVTMDHPLADEFALNFNEMIRADGGRGIFPRDVMAISLDDVERFKRRDNPRSSMDSALGVVARETFPKLRHKRILMCEFRLNYKNWRNISKTELEKKVQNSKSLLHENYEGNIEPTCFFIFDKSIYQQVKNHFARIFHSRTKNRIVTTEEDFFSLIF